MGTGQGPGSLVESTPENMVGTLRPIGAAEPLPSGSDRVSWRMLRRAALGLGAAFLGVASSLPVAAQEVPQEFQDGDMVQPNETFCFDTDEEPGRIAVLNAVVTNNASAGFVTFHPSGARVPETSTLNFVPGILTPNTAEVPIDANGDVCFTNSGHGPVDVVADLIGTRPGDALSAINARKLDTRNGRPLNIPTQASCNNAGWVERYADGSTEVAVYMGATERVLRYGIAPEEVPYNFEMDPSTCNAPAIIYSAINPATGRYSIYRRDLATGAESRIATTVNPSFENTYEPDPLFDQVFFTQHVQYQRNLMSTLGKTWGSSIQEFSVNDTGTTLAAIQTYTQPLRPAPVDDYVNVMVQWTDPVTRRQVLIGHEFTRNTGEDVREIQTATDGGQVLILRSLNHNPLTSLYEVKQHPTAISPDTGLPLAVFEPITIPTIEPGEIQSYRVLAEDSIVAILDEDGVKSTVEIDLQQGIITELTPEYGALVDISM